MISSSINHRGNTVGRCCRPAWIGGFMTDESDRQEIIICFAEDRRSKRRWRPVTDGRQRQTKPTRGIAAFEA